MGKDKKTTQTSEQTGSSSNMIDAASRDYIQNFLRPLGQEGVENILNSGPLFGGPTDTFQGGVRGLQGVMGGLHDIAGQAQGYQGQDFNAALRRFRPDIGDGGAMDMYRQEVERQQGGAAGALNFNAQRFDPSQAEAFFSPFQDEVVGGVQANADRQREQALSRSAAEATSRGAFGGSRSGILQSESLRNVNQDEAAQVAQLRNTGFQNAMQQAMGAHQGHQQTALGAAQAAQQGRLQDASRLGSLGLQASGLAQRGQIAQSQMGLDRALGLQRGLAQSGAQGLQGLGLGLNALGQRSQTSQQLIGAGEMERQIGNQQKQEDLFRYQQALGMGQGAYGGPLGSTSTNRQTGTQTNIEHGNFMSDLMGVGMMGAGLFMGGAPAAASGVMGGSIGGPGSNTPVGANFNPGMSMGPMPGIPHVNPARSLY